MFDPMGLNKEPEASALAQAAPSEAPAKKSWTDSPTLWFLLMIFDGVLMVVFGGLVAARLFAHWGAPPAPAPQSQTARKKAKTDAPKPPEAPKAPEAAKPPEPAKAEPPKQAAKEPEPPKTPAKAAAAEMVKPPKPSLVQAPPKAHEAPKPQGPAAQKPTPAPKPAAKAAEKAAPKTAAGAKVRAEPVSFKLHAPDAKKVQLAGAFLVHGGRKDMENSDGDWAVTIYLMPGNYRYTFLIDGKKGLDPENPKIDRGASVLNVLPVP